MSIRAQVNVSILAESIKTRPVISETPIYASETIFSDGSSIWTPCDNTTTELPSGVISKGVLAEPPDRWSKNLDPANHKVTVGTAKLKIIDEDSAYTLAIQGKKLAWIGTRKAVVRLYESKPGTTFTNAHIIGTYQLYNDSYSKGYVTQTLKSLTYTTKEDIFETYTVYLRESYTSEQMYLRAVDLNETTDNDNIPVDLDTKMGLFEHTNHYKSHPNKTVGYLQLETGEIVVRTGWYHDGKDAQGRQIYRCALLERGALGTSETAGTIDENDITKTENLPKMQGLIYAEETGPEWISLVLTGESINGQRTFPWGLDIDRSWLDLATLGFMHEHPQQELIARTVKSTGGKEFLEDEVFPIMGAFLNELPDGRLSPKTLTLPLQDTPSDIELNHYNCEHVKAGFSFTRELDEIHSHVITKWGYREAGDYFLYENHYLNEGSRQLYRGTEPLEREFKLLQPGEHTDASVSTLAQRLAMSHSFERVVMKVKALPTLRYLDLGDVVRVNFDKVRDMSSTRPNDVELKRAMLVTGVAPDKNTRQVVYTLEGYTRKPEPTFNSSGTVDNPPVTAEDVTNMGRSLGDVISIDTDGYVNGAGHTIPPGDYYYTGDRLEFRNTSPFTPSAIGRGISIFCKSTTHVEDNSTSGMFDLSVMSAHGGGAGGTETTPARGGEAGYFGAGQGGGGASLIIEVYDTGHGVSEWRRTIQSLDNGGITRGLNSNLSGMALSRQNGRIIGLPDDLSGSGGGGGGVVYTETVKPENQFGAEDEAVTINGSNGGRGGMGFQLMCGSFAWKAGNKIDVSGGSADSANGNMNMYGARGSDGYPGIFHLILPPGATIPPLSEYVVANHGPLESSLLGEKLGPGAVRRKVTDDPYRPAYDPEYQQNMNESCTVVSYIPADSVPEQYKEAFAGREWQADFDTLKDDVNALFDTAMRNDIDVYFGPSAPSDPANLSYWGNTSELVDWGSDGQKVPSGSQFIDDTWEPVPGQDAFWRMQVENWLALSEAERAQATADGKIKTYYTDSNNPWEWPTPSSYGDLLYVNPRSQVYRAVNSGGALVWDEDDAYLDELAMPTAGQMVIDANFAAMVDGKLTWATDDIDGVSGDSVSYGNYGEGGSTGARVINPTDQDLFYHSAKEYPAKRGDIFRVGGRIMRSSFNRTTPVVGIAALNDYGQIIWWRRIVTNQHTGNNQWVDISGFIDVNDLSTDLRATNFVKPFFGMAPGIVSPGSGTDTGYFDHVFVERANYWQASRNLPDQDQVSDGGGIITTPNLTIFSENDEVEIYYGFTAVGFASNECTVEVTDLFGQNAVSLVVEEKLGVGSGLTGAARAFSGKLTYKGISPSATWRKELRTVGTMIYRERFMHVRINRANAAE